MKTKKILAFILALSIFTLSGCNNNAEPTNANPYDYNSFEKTDWGMTPQETLKALNVNFNDVEIEPMLRIPESKSYTIGYNINILKPIKVNKLDAKITLVFRNLMVAGLVYGSLGLTDVYVTFPNVDYKQINLLSDNYEKEYGIRIINSTILNPANTTYDDLPDDLKKKVEEFFERRNLKAIDKSKHIFGDLSVMWTEIKTKDDKTNARICYNGNGVALAKYLSSNEDPAFEYLKKLESLRKK